jgi:hypothetical protein
VSGPEDGKTFKVQLKLTGGCCTGPDGLCCPAVSLMGNQPMSFAINQMSEQGTCTTTQVEVQVVGQIEKQVCMQLGLETSQPMISTMGGMGMHSETWQGVQVLPLDKATTLALCPGKGDCAPRQVEVTVHEEKGEQILQAPRVLTNAVTCATAPAYPYMAPPAVNRAVEICYPATSVALPSPTSQAVPVGYQAPHPVPLPAPPNPFPPYPMPMPPPAPVASCVALSSPPMMHPATRVCVVHAKDKSHLEMMADDGTCTVFKKIVVKTPGCDSLAVTTCKTKVKVAGKTWRATAEKVEVGQQGKILLTGCVHLVCTKTNGNTCIKADFVRVNSQDGRVEVLMEMK